MGIKKKSALKSLIDYFAVMVYRGKTAKNDVLCTTKNIDLI